MAFSRPQGLCEIDLGNPAIDLALLCLEQTLGIFVKDVANLRVVPSHAFENSLVVYESWFDLVGVNITAKQDFLVRGWPIKYLPKPFDRFARSPAIDAARQVDIDILENTTNGRSFLVPADSQVRTDHL